jgi:hypothetical protein
MGMAANPSGAHQAGRVFTGRIDEMCVSVRDRRTLTPAARFARNPKESAGVYLRHFRIWLAFPSVFDVRSRSYVIDQSGAEANDTVIPRIADAAVP